MAFSRRKLFESAGQAVAAGGLLGITGCQRCQGPASSSSLSESDTHTDPGTESWEAIRQNFPLNYDFVQMAGHLVTSHPLPVRLAIANYRRELDQNPSQYLREHYSKLEEETRRQAARYLDDRPENIALTDSTTEGLALLYSGIRLAANEEIITTHHDYYSTHFSLRFRSQRETIGYRQIPIFSDVTKTTVDEIVSRMEGAIQDHTRVMALTWVHSITGLKFPVRQVAEVVAKVNARRDPKDRILVCVDGVHGLGVEKETPEDLGIDFLIAGCHKWMFGPRGTGIIWGKKEAWPRVSEVIPTFSGTNTPGRRMTPGGFCAFEHRWALAEAFKFHARIGRSRVTDRIHELAQHCKEGLNQMPHVRVITPQDDALSSGLICFDVEGMTDNATVKRLAAKKIMASTTPYITSHARLAVGLWNNHEDVEKVLAAIHSLA